MERQTMSEAGYTYVRYDTAAKVHILRNEDGMAEIWSANKNHASYGIIYKNTHLEFVASESSRRNQP